MIQNFLFKLSQMQLLQLVCGYKSNPLKRTNGQAYFS